MVVTLQKDLKRSLRDLLNWEEGRRERFLTAGAPASPEGRCAASLQLGRAFPQASLPPCIMRSLFIWEPALRRERRRERIPPHTHTHSC